MAAVTMSYLDNLWLKQKGKHTLITLTAIIDSVYIWVKYTNLLN